MGVSPNTTNMSPPTFTFDTTAEEVATVFANEIRGKNVLITGTSINGIGFEAARVIAKYANLVIITGYNVERLKLSEEALKEEFLLANIRRLTLDLSSFDAVRKAAAEVNAYPELIHVLINNAAAAIVPTFKLTVDKLENQFATNHVGHFLFTNLIVPKILAARTATYTPRVVFVSSSAHIYGNGIDFATLENPDAAKYNDWEAYGRTKSANILTAIEFSRRLKGKIIANSLHPGVIFTNIQKEEALPAWQARGMLDADGKPIKEADNWKTIPQGAATTIAAAFDPRFNDKPGAYLDDSNDATASIAPHSSDPAVAQNLWTVTEKIVGQSFNF